MEAQFRLSVRQPDGETLRTHLEAVRAATGRTPPELEVEDLPLALAGVWEMYAEMRGGTGSNGFALLPVSHQAIKAYCDLYGVAFTPWEVETFMAMDAAAIAVMNDGARRKG